MPVNVAASIRAELMPLMSEIALLAMRLSMAGDKDLKEDHDPGQRRDRHAD